MNDSYRMYTLHNSQHVRLLRFDILSHTVFLLRDLMVTSVSILTKYSTQHPKSVAEVAWMLKPTVPSHFSK